MLARLAYFTPSLSTLIILRLAVYTNSPWINLFKLFYIFRVKRLHKLFKFVCDLNFRFSKKRLFSFKYYFRRRPLLPVFANIHLTRKFIRYRGMHVTVGNIRHLPYFLTYSGMQTGYIILKNKKSFFQSRFKRFLFLYYSFSSIFIAKYHIAKFIKSSVFTNFVKSLKRFIINYYTNFKKLKFFKLLKIKYFLKNSYFMRKNFLFLNYRLNHFIFYDYLSVVNFFDKMEFDRKIKWDHYKIFRRKFFKKPRYWGYKRLVFYIKLYRLNLKKLFSLKGKQKKISLFVQSLVKTKLSGMSFYLNFELRLVHFLIKIGFASTFEESKFYIVNRLVFINNKVCVNSSYIVNKFDIIQFAVSRYFFINFRYSFAIIVSKIYKLKIHRYSKQRIPFFKQRVSKYSGEWIYKSLWLISKFPKFIELDYLTMTAIVIYKPSTKREFDRIIYKNLKLLALRNYNWKYLY